MVGEFDEDAVSVARRVCDLCNFFLALWERAGVRAEEEG
jgi:hypothetical protein